jgi:hypothetical protein
MHCHVFLALVSTLALFAGTDAARQLAQNQGGDPLSNSNGCLGTIPKCEQGACATRNVMGVARWVCLRCLANYEPVVDASGQDNILQCGEWDSLAGSDSVLCWIPAVAPSKCTGSSGVLWKLSAPCARWSTDSHNPAFCAPLQLLLPLPLLPAVCPRGFYEDSSTPGACTRCPANQYCPGGDKVENPTSRGSNNTCGDNLVTRSTGARSQSDCLAPAGFARTSPTTATQCAQSEYAPQFNRLSTCLRCQSGLAEDPALNLAVSARATKKAVCSEWSCR